MKSAWLKRVTLLGALEAAGGALVLAGLWLFWPPAALVLGGAVLILVANVKR